MDATELKRQWAYKQMLTYQTKLKSDVIAHDQEIKILISLQEGIIIKEVQDSNLDEEKNSKYS